MAKKRPVKRFLKLLELGVRRSFIGLLQLTGRKSKQASFDPNQLGDAPSILFLRQDRIGDAIVTTPLLVAVRERYPNGRITMLLGKNNRAIAPLLPIECRTLVYQKNLSADFAMLRALRKESIDVLIDLTDNASATSSILVAAIAPKIAIGIEKENSTVYNIVVPRLERSTTHISRRIAELLRPLGIDPERIPLKPSLRIPATSKVAGRIGINISAGSDSRRASEETYSAVARTLAERHREVAILCEPKDTEKANRIKVLSNQSNVSVLGPTHSYAEFASLVASCEYLITPDTSVVHLAAAAEVPMVVIYAPIPEGLCYWTPTGVPYEMAVQRPSLETLEPGVVLELFTTLEKRLIARPTPHSIPVDVL